MFSDRFGAGLAGANADGFKEFGDEDLAVPDLARAGGIGDGLDDLVGDIVGDGQFDLGLRQEVDDIFGATLQLGVAALPPEALDLGDGDALDADVGNRLANVIEFERLDDRGDHFHCISPLEKSGAAWIGRPGVVN